LRQSFAPFHGGQCERLWHGRPQSQLRRAAPRPLLRRAGHVHGCGRRMPVVPGGYLLSVVVFRPLRRLWDRSPCCLSWDGPFARTPNSADLRPSNECSTSVARSPRRITSRTAAARLGMRCLKRKSSIASSSSGASMICRRSPRYGFPSICAQWPVWGLNIQGGYSLYRKRAKSFVKHPRPRGHDLTASQPLSEC
jgi:hypothetical protein